MTDCETHEIALERRAAGDLREREVRELEAHLADCSSCQSYARAVTRMKTMIETSDANVRASRTWPRVNAYVVSQEERMRRKVTRTIPIGMLFAAILLLTSLFQGGTWITLFSSGFLLACAATLAGILLRRRELRSLADRPGDLLALMRREHARTRVLATAGALLALLLGVLWLGTGIESPPAWMPAFGHRTRPSFAFGVAALLIGYAGWVVLVVLPRLRREAAELED